MFSFAAIICQAQDHLRFMDIPIDGDLDSFCSKLIQEKGLFAGTITDDEQYMSMKNIEWRILWYKRLYYLCS